MTLGRRSRAAIPEPEREGCQSFPPANGEEALAVIPSPSLVWYGRCSTSRGLFAHVEAGI